MKTMKKLTLAMAIGWATFGGVAHAELTAEQTKNAETFLNTYAALAYANYHDSLEDAKKLKVAIDAFAANPTEDTYQKARQAWLVARESYGQSEIFRLSQGPIDAEEGWVAEKYGNLEGQINAWPLDENMIDYTVDADGQLTGHNIIQSKGDYTPGGEKPTAVNIDKITPEVLTELNENGGEANVASGYHAIEFLLWGQDQDYANFVEDKVTHGATVAGQRPLSDFTTDKFAARRLEYLKAAANKLVDDLTLVTSAWDPKTGEYRAALTHQLKGDDAKKNIPYEESLRNIFIGMGQFVKSELANERIAVAVLTPSEEDEHSCFSDNTHRDIDANFQGFVNVFRGTYQGKKYGASLESVLPTADAQAIDKMIESAQKRIAKIDKLAKTTMHFDYQIHPENRAERQNIVSLKNELRRIGDQMVVVAKNYGVSLTTQDVTDSEENRSYEENGSKG
ncbi:imelysin family protein [Basilea psittacipulmonis]|uniref:Imelysin n=1 Tax=Basilea psittacipulmonis DSM 24701 TaxID=1072685 RepID=A0A077DIB0_9BURK|nr:imelysin family protein [Basilea psittacipulmonis]AIL32903.1 imelysin [Basilea psittacipulmonis DSM 24701]